MSDRVEPATWAAAHPISLLHQECFPDDPWGVEAIIQIMRMPGFIGRVGWVRDCPVGFALALDLGKEVEILSLGVMPDRRRAGVASALLETLFLEAGLRAAQSVVLEVAVDNAAARALYAANGFTAVGYRRNYYRQAGRPIDGLILRRKLGTAQPGN